MLAQTLASICTPPQVSRHAWCRNNTEFLPAALVIGLQPGMPLVVPIVVVAEDGVTSQRYYVAGTLPSIQLPCPSWVCPTHHAKQIVTDPN